MKIAYIGIDLFYPVLKALDANDCEIVRIFSCRTDNVTEFNTKIVGYAKEHHIPYTLDKITRKEIEELISMGVEAIICAGYYYLIPVVHEIPMLNVHPTLLPVGRGLWPMPVIIMEKHKKSGVTIHKIEKEFDTGDIVLQREFEMDDNENLESYMNKVNNLLVDMVHKLVNDFNNLYSSATPQGHGEYMKAPNEKDYIITEKTSIDEADTILRAFYGYECYYDDGKEHKCIIRGRAVKEKRKGYSYLKLKDGYIEFL